MWRSNNQCCHAETSGRYLGSVRTMTNTTGRHREDPFCFTFTVRCISVELETSLTQAQERPVRVDTLAPDTHIVSTAFIHIYNRQKGKGKADEFKEITARKGSQDLLHIDYSPFSVFIMSTGKHHFSYVSQKECVIKRSSEHKTHWPFGELNGILANRKQWRGNIIFLSFLGWKHFPLTRKINNAS